MSKTVKQRPPHKRAMAAARVLGTLWDEYTDDEAIREIVITANVAMDRLAIARKKRDKPEPIDMNLWRIAADMRKAIREG